MMTASELLIRRAHERSAAKAGTRVRVRMSSELKRSAEACARAVADDLTEWVNTACMNFRGGKFERVAFEPETLNATREGSECVWVNAPKGMKGAHIRLAVACAVRVTVEKTPAALMTPFDPGLREGKDYLVEVSQ